jgi:ribosomal protection tetracycline resistance protein
VTAIEVFDGGAAVARSSLSAPQIGKLWGLAEIQIGDAIGLPRAVAELRSFAPPTLETVVVPRNSRDKSALHTALAHLAEQDPLINVRQDDYRQELFVSLYGEVQKEVIQQQLAEDFHIEVEFRETTPICIERPIDSGTAVELLGAASNPYLATVGLRIDPAPAGTGLDFRMQVGIRSVPIYVYKTVDDFSRALEATVHNALQRGLQGWEVTDCRVTITECGYSSPGTGAGDFRKLTPVVLRRALRRAGTKVCEPIHRFQLDGPADSLQPTVRVLAQLGAKLLATALSGSSFSVEGELAAGHLRTLQQQLRPLTHGEGVLELAFARYEAVTGAPPTRARSGDD